MSGPSSAGQGFKAPGVPGQDISSAATGVNVGSSAPVAAAAVTGVHPGDLAGGRSSGRQRATNSRYAGGEFGELTSTAMRDYSKSLPKIGAVEKKRIAAKIKKEKAKEKSKKGPEEIVIGGEAVAPGQYSVAVVKRKPPPKRKKVQDKPQVSIMSKKEQEQNDIEESLIQQSAEQRARISEYHASLARELSGPSRPIELEAEIKKSSKECTSPLLDWTKPEARFIGKLCKIYWDGDKVWYYGRIINYDTAKAKHMVYYLTDATTEWLDVNDESVMVGESVVIVKNRSVWPALHFWASKNARAVMSRQRGYKQGCEYVEYFNDTKVREIGYVQRASLYSISQAQDLLPKKPSGKFSESMDKAMEEQLADRQDDEEHSVSHQARDPARNCKPVIHRHARQRPHSPHGVSEEP